MRRKVTKTIAVCLIGLSLILQMQGKVHAQSLPRLVKRVQMAVVTIATYDLKGDTAGIGTGFFVDEKGHLITNYHVLKNAYRAEVRTRAGEIFPIRTIVAENEMMDLLKVRVEIPTEKYSWVNVESDFPEIAEQVLVVGSPFGLEQTASDGIVSAIRDMPGIGTFFQMSAPISKGSSGSPVVNMQGRVVGVVTFMLVRGQNLNFAVSGKSILDLDNQDLNRSVSDWTYRSSLKAPQIAETLCRDGLKLSLDGQYNRALDFYKSATDENPQNPMAWYGLSNCYLGMGNPEQVASTLKKAIEANPDNALLYYNLGNHYAKMGHYREAVDAYRHSIRINPDDHDAHENMGLSLSGLGRYEDALKALVRVTDIKPEYAPGYYHMGLTLAELGRTEEALAAYKKAVRYKPDFLAAHNNMGILYMSLEKGKEAIEAHKQAIRIRPDHPLGHYNLGAAYLIDGDRGAALEEYKILKGLDPRMAEHLFKRIYK